MTTRSEHVGVTGRTAWQSASTGAAAVGAGAVVLVAAVLSPLRDTIFGHTNAALVLVVIVAAAASVGGRFAGVVTAVVASLAFNFFLTAPYFSLNIDEPHNVVTVVLLLVVGVTVGEFARNRGRVADTLRFTRRSAERLERVAELLVSDRSHEQLCDDVGEQIRSELGLASVQWFPYDTPTGLPVMSRTGWVESDIHRYGVGGLLLPTEGVELPVTYAGARLGALALVPRAGVGVSAAQRRVAVALSDLLASALARGSSSWTAE